MAAMNGDVSCSLFSLMPAFIDFPGLFLPAIYRFSAMKSFYHPLERIICRNKLLGKGRARDGCRCAENIWNSLPVGDQRVKTARRAAFKVEKIPEPDSKNKSKVRIIPFRCWGLRRAGSTGVFGAAAAVTCPVFSSFYYRIMNTYFPWITILVKNAQNM